MEASKDRIIWVDYLKAFACFLVVLGHLLQSFQLAGIDHNVNVTKFIVWFIYLFHMPLFMMISGFLYCNSKNLKDWKEYFAFIRRKIVNLIIPYIVFYLLFIGINMLFSSSVNTQRGLGDILRIFNNPIAPYWFLYALASIFIFIPIAEKICKNNKFVVVCVLTILKIISFFVNAKIYIIESIMEYAIYFYVGKFISMTEKKKSPKSIIIYSAIYIFMAYCYYVVQPNVNYILDSIIKLLFALTGTIICVDIFKKCNRSTVLQTFKNYTFQIYLLHTIFAAGIRIVLLNLGVTNYYVHFVLGLTFSIYIPCVIGKISNKIKYTNIVFYPTKIIDEMKGKTIMKEKKLNGTVIVTYRCNARCTMCNRYKCPSKPEEEISIETIKKLPKMYFTNITGGEPFIREDLPEIVRELYKKSDRIVISTNGFFTDRIIKLCEEFPNVGIRISIEGLEETNNKIRGLKDGYNKGYTTLKKLVEMKHPDVGFGMTVQDANAKDLVALYKISDELNMEFATASLHNSFYFVEAKNIIHDRPMVAQEFENLVNELLNSNSPKKWFRAYFNHGLINYIYGQKRLLPCDMAFDTFFIDPYGDVMPCNGTKDKEVMGNLNKCTTWDELWESKDADKVRAKVRCCDRQCWMIGSVSPSMHKYIWKPALWVIKHKFLRFFKKKKYSMYELPIVRDYRDGKVTKEELDKCSTCDMNCVVNDGLSKKSKAALKDMSGEEIVDRDIETQMKKRKR